MVTNHVWLDGVLVTVPWTPPWILCAVGTWCYSAYTNSMGGGEVQNTFTRKEPTTDVWKGSQEQNDAKTPVNM